MPSINECLSELAERTLSDVCSDLNLYGMRERIIALCLCLERALAENSRLVGENYTLKFDLDRLRTGSPTAGAAVARAKDTNAHGTD